MSSKYCKYAQEACVSSWNLKTCCALPQTKSVIWIAWLLKCGIRIGIRERGWLGTFTWGVESLGFWGVGMWVLAGQAQAVQAVHLIPNSVRPRVSQSLDKHSLWAALRNISTLCPHSGEGLLLALKGFFCSWTWTHGPRFWLGEVKVAKHGHTDFSLFDGEVFSVFGPVCIRSSSQGYFVLNPNYLKLHLCSLKRWKTYWGDTPILITLSCH